MVYFIASYLSFFLPYGMIGEIGGGIMSKHIVTINHDSLQKTAKLGGCGECQTSCQSACKTSCTIGNQVCRNKE